MKGLQEFLQKTFKVSYAETLFPLEWSNLTQQRCPICSLKLKCTQKGLYICSSKKHKTFVIKKAKYDEVVDKYLQKNG